MHTARQSFLYRALLFLYPFLLAYYPILALRNHNILYVDLATILRSLLLATAGTAALLALTTLLVRSPEKASAITAVTVALFLSYGHLYTQLEQALGEPVRHRYLAAGELAVWLALVGLVLKKDQAARALAQFLAAASLVLVALVVFESARYDLEVSRATASAMGLESAQARSPEEIELPDFYLIILDAHTRSDVLREVFGYDNGGFIQQLRDMGFYVSECSQSNYASTILSLTSALSGNYVQDIVEEGQVLPSLKSSALNQALEARGYTTIAFENRSRGQFDLKEDVHLARNQLAFGRFDLRGGINEFEKMMVETSFLGFVVNAKLIPGLNETSLEEWEYWEHYYQTHYILSELENLPDVPGPKFVYAHLMVPHPPYIFTPDGAYDHKFRQIEGYRSNVQFIDSRLPGILNTLLEKSDPRPVIVVMGDHGPPTHRNVTEGMRMATLNAYLVNDAAQAQLYPTITPVNAFRVILNAHYGGDYPLLEDASYYAYKAQQLEGAERIANACKALD